MCAATFWFVFLEDLVDSGGDGDGVSAHRRGLPPHALAGYVPQKSANVRHVLGLCHVVITCTRTEKRLLSCGLFRLDAPTSKRLRHHCIKIITRRGQCECSDLLGIRGNPKDVHLHCYAGRKSQSLQFGDF